MASLRGQVVRRFTPVDSTRDPLPLLMLAIAFGIAAGYLLVDNQTYGVFMLAAGFVVMLFALRPVAVAVMAVAGVVVVSQRVAGSISVSDVLTASATVAALPALASRRSVPILATLRRWLLVYLLGMSVTLVLNYAPRSLLEFLHRAVLVGGGLAVGAWVEQEGRTRIALQLLTVSGLVVALAAMEYSVTHGFASAYPLGFQKNYIGSVLAMFLLLVIIVPELSLPGWAVRWEIRGPVMGVLTLGLAASQSRGGIISMIAGLFVWFFRTHSDVRRRSFIGAVILAVAFGIYAERTISGQDVSKTPGVVNSRVIRQRVEAQTRRIWHTSPIVGVGIRYYFDPYWAGQDYYVQAPNNLVDEALAEGGIIEAAGLVLWLGGSLFTVIRRRDPLMLAGTVLVVARLAQGTVDIYWTAGNSALPWMVVGMGAARLAAQRKPLPGARDGSERGYGGYDDSRYDSDDAEPEPDPNSSAAVEGAGTGAADGARLAPVTA